MPSVIDAFLRAFRALGKTPQILLIDRIGLYLQQHGRDVTLAEGYCHGLAVFWAYMRKNGREDEYFKLITKIALWDGVEDLDTEFEKLFAHMEWLHRKHELIFLREQIDIEKTIEIVRGNEEEQGLKEEFKFSFVFKKDEVANTLQELCKKDQILLLTSHHHVVAVIYENEKYHFFDANSLDGVVTFDSIDAFVNAKNGLFQSLLFPESLSHLQELKNEIQKKITGLPVPENFPLHIEVLKGENDPKVQYPSSAELMKSILAKRSQKNLKIDLNESGYRGMTSLIIAAIEDDLESLKSLIELGVNINAKDKEGNTALHYASMNNNPRIVEYLAKNGADLSATNSLGETALHFYNSDKINTKLKADLIRYGGDILVPDHRKQTPLAKFLIGYSEEDGAFLIATALQYAIITGNSAKFLSIFYQTKDSQHPLYIKKLFEMWLSKEKKSVYSFLLENNKFDLIEYLINKGAPITYEDFIEIEKYDFPHKVNLINVLRVRLFHEAIEKNDPSLVNQLLKEDPNLIKTSYLANSPITTALNSKNSAMVEFLIGKGAAYEEVGNKNINPIFYALNKEDLASAKVFLQHGVKIDKSDDIYVETNKPSRVSEQELKDFITIFMDKSQKTETETLLERWAFVIAIKRGFLNIVERMLNSSPQLIDQLEEDDNTALHIAAQQNNVEVMKLLLAKSKTHNVNTLNDNKETPLHIAAKKRNDRMVRFLLAENSDPNIVDSEDFTPLHYAARENCFACVQALVESGADVNAGVKNKNLTPLFFAFIVRNLEMIKYLISKNADIHNIGFYFVTLEQAVATNNLEIIKYAVEELKLDLSTIRSSKLIDLIKAGHVALLQYLVDKGVDLPEYDSDGRLVSDYLASYANSYTYLLQHNAIKKGDLTKFVNLLEKQSNVNVTGYDNKTFLHVAIENGRLDIVDYLLQAGSYVHARADYQQTPLHLAVKLGRIDIVKSLLSYGANVNVRMADGNTPLHLAALNKDNEIVKLLLNNGADVNATNKKDETSFTIGKHKKTSTKENVYLIEEITNLFNKFDFKTYPQIFNLLTNLHQVSANCSQIEYQNNLLATLNNFKANLPQREYLFFSSNTKQITSAIESAKQKVFESSQMEKNLEKKM